MWFAPHVFLVDRLVELLLDPTHQVHPCHLVVLKGGMEEGTYRGNCKSTCQCNAGACIITSTILGGSLL